MLDPCLNSIFIINSNRSNHHHDRSFWPFASLRVSARRRECFADVFCSHLVIWNRLAARRPSSISFVSFELWRSRCCLCLCNLACMLCDYEVKQWRSRPGCSDGCRPSLRRCWLDLLSLRLSSALAHSFRLALLYGCSLGAAALLVTPLDHRWHNFASRAFLVFSDFHAYVACKVAQL